eukprot:g3381.t1
MPSVCHFGQLPKMLRLKLEHGLSQRNRQNQRSRLYRIIAVQSEPTSQITKSSSTWPESISTFFTASRKRKGNSIVVESPLNDIPISTSQGGSDEPPPDKREPITDEQPPDDEEEHELLNLAEAEALANEKGCDLPQDFIKAASSSGIRAATLHKYLSLQSLWSIGILVRTLPWFRDRLIADSSFLFKVFTEIIIDSGCATLAEVRKRGADFFDEFEFYLSDMIVGLVLDIALVSLLAPVAVVGAKPASATKTGLSKYIAKLPSAMFEANLKGVREYTLSQRIVSFFYKGLLYSVVGSGCGLVGQGMANSLMHMRRHMAGGATADDVAVPPLIKTALVWGLFMGVSSNTRYQIVVGLERLVDVSIAKRVPQIAYFTTIVIRFINNVVGGENFIDMARWAGVQ